MQILKSKDITGKSLRHLGLWLLIVSLGTPLQAQSPEQQREAFFLQAMLQPDQLATQLNSYAGFKDKPGKEELFKIYQQCAPLFKEPMLLPAGDFLSHIYLKSRLLSLRTKKHNQLNEEELTAFDKSIQRLSEFIPFMSQNVYFENNFYSRYRTGYKTEVNMDLVYYHFVYSVIQTGKSAPEKKTIGKDAALVSIMSYRQFSDLSIDEGEPKLAYMASVKSDRDAGEVFIPLQSKAFSKGEIFTQYLRQYGDPFEPAALEQDSTYFYFWQPIDQYLEGIKTVYLQSNGLYNDLALEALPSPKGGFVMDHVEIVRSYDDIPFPAKKRNYQATRMSSVAGFEIFGYPDYEYKLDRNSTSYARAALPKRPEPLSNSERALYNWVMGDDNRYPDIDYNTPGLPSGTLKPLVMSHVEARVLTELFTRKKLAGHTYLDITSTEYNLKRINAPYILHLATHSSFGSKNANAYATDYIDRVLAPDVTGIYLAGANESFKNKAYFRLFMQKATPEDSLLLGLSGPPGQESMSNREKLSEHLGDINDHNGVLTIEEISQLNISDTEILSLSSCGPQSFDRVPGAMVSLAKTFLKNGVETVLGSLWPVNDEASAFFMLKFYKHWMSGKTKMEALRMAQTDIRKIPGYEHPHFWGGWMLYGQTH